MNNDDVPSEIEEIVIEIQEAIQELDRIEQLREDTIKRIKNTTLVKSLALAKQYAQIHDERRRLLALGILHDLEKFLRTEI
jgi:hypothetical protein